MKRIMSTLIACAMLLSLTNAAMAETVSFTGNVTAQTETCVYAPIGGTAQSVDVTQGQRISANDTIATLKTNKVYAEQSGTVTGVFAQIGDSAETLESLYGGVMYMEKTNTYQISATTAKAYNANKNKIIHVGETVYLKCVTDGKHKGTGKVIAVSGASYTVEVTKGAFKLSESVNIYRNEKYTDGSRIGRGNVSRTEPIAVTGEGSIAAIHVSDGDVVEKGQLLFETLDGTYDMENITGNEIKSTVSGVVSSVNIAAGGSVAKGDTVLTVYEDSAMWIEASVPEGDLDSIHVGDTVNVEFDWNEEEKTVATVLWIGAIGTVSESDGTISYPVYLSFTPNEFVRYQMGVTLTTLDEGTAADAEDE